MEYQSLLKDSLALYSGKTKAAEIHEISELEKKIGSNLPKSLKEFFLLVGGDYDIIWGGGGGDSIKTINYTLNLATSLLEETSVKIQNYFPFSSYNDDQFLFVYVNDGEDPPVYRFETELYYCGDDYMPGSSSWGYPQGVSKVADSFSKMINNLIKKG